MSRPSQPGGRPEPAASAPTSDAASTTWYWVIPALTFIVGLTLGAVFMAASADPDTDDAAVLPTATAASTGPSAAGTPSDRIVTVPASCEQGLDRARTALSTVGEAVDALGALDTARLQELLNRLEQARLEVDRLADQCRQEVPDRN
jgi:hypothetical protein